jgi:hypothetical protein
LLLVLTAAAENIEQPAASRRLPGLAAAAGTRQRILKFGLTPAVSAAAGQSLPLPLELAQLAPRILDPVIHLQALRAPDQSPAEDEEALEAARVLHGRLRALEHAVSLGDLLVDAGQVAAIGPSAALRRGEVLLELHAADLLVALCKS